MWDHVINIHSSELLSTKTKKSKKMNRKKKKKGASQYFLFYFKYGQFTFYT